MWRYTALIGTGPLADRRPPTGPGSEGPAAPSILPGTGHTALSRTAASCPEAGSGGLRGLALADGSQQGQVTAGELAPKVDVPNPGKRVAGLRGHASGCGLGRCPSPQCLVQGAGQRYPAVQSRQAQQLADLRRGAGYLQAAAVRGCAVCRADQHGEPDGVDEADLAECLRSLEMTM